MKIANLRPFLVVGVMVLLVACSSTATVVRPSPDSFEFSVQDNPRDLRFELALKSNDSRAICLAVEDWPSEEGALVVQRDDVAVKTSGGVLPAESELLSTYCPGGCGVKRIEPRGMLRGSISYEVFGSPQQLAQDLDKKLLFTVNPYYCSPSR